MHIQVFSTFIMYFDIPNRNIYPSNFESYMKNISRYAEATGDSDVFVLFYGAAFGGTWYVHDREHSWYKSVCFNLIVT